MNGNKQVETMGQYSEWLRYHEIERQLQTELQSLEGELTQLQARLIAHLCSDEPIVRFDNEILHALTISLNGTTSSDAPSPLNSEGLASTISAPEKEKQEEQETPIETISPALSARSSLPNFGPEDVPGDITAAGEDSDEPPLTSQIQQPIPSTPHSEMALLPEDMTAFFEEYTQTDPQLELPWWLRNITKANAGNGGPIDQESIRTNRLVQRWLERWGRPSSQERQPKEEHS
jgi:hypothetical protein